ncbi:MAG TPA: hypothetical protein VK661_13540, partial [Planctomycetota bacterium]|nr:hypothetical protein [Planctomycetota bacterium]
MPRLSRFAILSALVFFLGCAQAPVAAPPKPAPPPSAPPVPVHEEEKGPSVVDKIIDEGRNRSEVMPLLDHLVNKIGPRLTSSDRLTRAASWARHQFESFGLKHCRLEEWGTFPVGFNRGPWSGRMLEP